MWEVGMIIDSLPTDIRHLSDIWRTSVRRPLDVRQTRSAPPTDVWCTSTPNRFLDIFALQLFFSTQFLVAHFFSPRDYLLLYDVNICWHCCFLIVVYLFFACSFILSFFWKYQSFWYICSNSRLRVWVAWSHRSQSANAAQRATDQGMLMDEICDGVAQHNCTDTWFGE